MTIIWDFNGTLLNDMQVCIDCMNVMLKERNLPALNLERYREIFTFPVRDYYMKLGFDFEQEPYDIPAHRFIDLYRESLHLAPLQQDAIEMLGYFSRRGYRQIILSAMEQVFLEETLEIKGIPGYFDHVAGIRDHFAEGKLEIARELINSAGITDGEVRIIGDTEHDYEVAHALNIPCILVAHGHQSYERLKKYDCLLIRELKELKKYL